MEETIIKTIKQNSQRIVYYLLLIWIALPFILLVFSNFIGHYAIDSIWYTSMLVIGLIGVGMFLYRKDFNLSKPAKLFIIFLAWTLLAVIFAKSKQYALMGSYSLQSGFISFIAYAGFLFLSYSIKGYKKYNNLFKYLIFFTTLICLIQLFNGTNLYMEPFYNQNHFAYYLSMVIICTVMSFLNANKHKYIYILPLIIMIYTLLKNNTFGCYLAIIFTLILIFIYQIINKKVKDIIIISILFITVSLLTNNGSYIKNNFKELATDTQKIVEEENIVEVQKAGSHRWELWTNGIKIIGDNPLLGYGPENFKAEYHRYGTELSFSPHNLYISIAMTSGIPGLLLYCSAIIITLLALIKQQKKINKTSIMGLFCVICYLASLFFGSSAFYTAPYFFIFLGSIFRFYETDKII